MGTAFDFFASWTIGFLGSFHCLGMCGPLILAYSLHTRGSRNPALRFDGAVFHGEILHHLAFHSGRLLTYGFLGALGGLLFHFASVDRLFLHLRSGMTLLGGVLMIFLGLVLLRAIPLPRLTLFPAGDTEGKRFLGRLLESPSGGSKVALGMAVGFLPCGLSWAMIVKAATTQNALAGFVIMLAFGLGTVPALFLPGLFASILSVKLRVAGEKLAALSVIAMGLMLVSKGAKVLV
jgi:uncharacterized protein